MIAMAAEALADRIASRRDELVEVIRALVAEQSVRGHEEPVQRLVEERLRQIGFTTERVTVDAEAALPDPYAGHPFQPFDGRSSGVGPPPGADGGRSMHLSGHIDVVPVERPDLWTDDLWGGEVDGARLYGRGSADMKGGVA